MKSSPAEFCKKALEQYEKVAKLGGKISEEVGHS